jgi:O-6-methylguanine DNA methyltransferase
MTDKQKRVYKITSLIPLGFVLTYKKLAQLSGVKNPRVVGNILHKNTDPQNIPCHRVVHSDGSLAKNYAFGGIKKQEEKLEKEGIEFVNGKVKLSKHLWKIKN